MHKDCVSSIAMNIRFQELFEKTGVYMVDFQATPETCSRLTRYFQIETERELLDKLGVDFYYLSCRDISQNESCFQNWNRKPSITETRRVCPFGILWQRGAYSSKFSVDEAIEGPLRHASTSQDILSHVFPQPEDFDFSSLLQEAEENHDRIRIGGLWSGIMGDSYRMYGFQRFMTDIAEAPEMIHTLVDKMTDAYLGLNDKYFSMLKGKVEIWFFGNDFGSQIGLLFSPAMWYEFFYENIRRLCDLAHSYGLKVMMHSCGSIRPIIPYLISAGVDILDPVQTTAKDMDPRLLSQEFGRKIVFHGGIDTQQLLPCGTPSDVRHKRDELLRTFTDYGGYILSPSQILGRDIPLENILAIYNDRKAVD